MNVAHLFRQLPPVRPQTQWHFLLLFPWFIPLITYWLLGDRYVNDALTFVVSTLLNMGLVVVCLLVLDQFTQRIIRSYPNLGQTWSRVWRLLLVFMLITTVFVAGAIFCYDYFHWFGYSHDPSTTSRILLMNIGANLLSVGIDETVYSLTRWRENALEKEQLRKETLQSQFESLKSQVNPHFLFNSLNSLSSLIADEPEQAEEFVDKMAKVYRYLLQTNEGELTTLATELRFIDSYYHLLKTRYQTGIKLQTNIPDSFADYRLPPLTLQMLVENAVKHNVIQANKPLVIEIRVTDDDQLMIRNNLQRKTVRMASNQVGLTNIETKYRLLAQTTPVVTDDDGYFTVVLPLLLPANV